MNRPQRYDRLPRRPVWQALKRGWRRSCPACGQGDVVSDDLSLADHCPHCGEALHHARIGNILPLVVIPAALGMALLVATAVEDLTDWPLLAELALGLVSGAGVALLLLAPVKGAAAGVAWALSVEGFDPHHADPAALLHPRKPEPVAAADPEGAPSLGLPIALQ
jgi:uncharacterized protein (DUF983 family)